MAARPGAPAPVAGGGPVKPPPPANKPPPPARIPSTTNTTPSSSTAATSPRTATTRISQGSRSSTSPSPPPPPSKPPPPKKPPTIQPDLPRSQSLSTPSSPSSPGKPDQLPSTSTSLSKSNSSSAISQSTSSSQPPTVTRQLSNSVSAGTLRSQTANSTTTTSSTSTPATTTSSSNVQRSSSSGRLPTIPTTTTTVAPVPKRIVPGTTLTPSNSVPQLPLAGVNNSSAPASARLKASVTAVSVSNSMATGARTVTSRSPSTSRLRTLGRLPDGMDAVDVDEPISPSVSPAPSEPSRPPGPTDVPVESAASTAVRSKVDPFPLPFKPAVEQMVQEFEPSDVLLEQPVFDIVIHVDQLFPDLKSCRGSKLKEVIVQMEKELKEVDEVLSKDVLKISLTKDIATRAVANAIGTIHALQAKMEDIKRKAATSETMTEEICKDVRALDNAKKHLTGVIRAIRNLIMLNETLTNLQHMKEQREWKDCNRTYRYVVEMFHLFDSYQQTPHIQAMMLQFNDITKQLREQLFDEFKDNFILLAKAEDALREQVMSMEELDKTREFMYYQCKLMEQIGEHAKMDIINWFTKTRFEAYSDEYGVGKLKFNIDTISQRFLVFRAELVEYEKHFTKVFPAGWQMQAQMAKEFVDITKRHIAKILAANSQNTAANRKMAAALMESLKFEKFLTSRFVTSLQKPTNTNNNNAVVTTLPTMEPIVPTFVGIISDCFNPYMVIFEQRERNQLTSKLNEMNSTEDWTEVQHEGYMIYGTCEALFRYIGESIKAVTTLSTDQTFFNVSQTYYKTIEYYQTLLFDRLPENENEAAQVDTFVPVNLTVTFGRPNQAVEQAAMIPTFDQDDIHCCCVTMNTCTYAREMIENLEKGIKRSIDERFKDSINFQPLSETYHKLAVDVMKLLCIDIWKECKPHLLRMVKQDWGKFEDVGDRSPWLTPVREVLFQILQQIIDTVDISYHHFFFTQIVQTFIPNFQEEILYQCRKIQPLAAQQLILDMIYIKNDILLQMHHIVPTPKEPNHDADAEDEEVIRKREQQRKETAKKGIKMKIFIKHVQEQMGKCESLLKVLSGEDDQLISSFRTFFPTAPDTELLRIFKLRSLRFEIQKKLIDKYNQTVPQEQQIHMEGRAWDNLVEQAGASVGAIADLVNPLAFATRFGNAVRSAAAADRDRNRERERERERERDRH